MAHLKRRKNKDWIKAYLDLVLPRTESPERFHFWCAVGAIAGVLRRQVSFPQGHFAWYPNFFTVLVGEPSVVHKSTSIDMALDLLKEIPDVKLGPDCTTWQAFISAVAGSQVEMEISAPTSDELVFQPMSAVTMGISELGTFLIPDDPIMISALTELFDCREKFEKSTKTQGSDFVINPFVNFLAGTTPRWLEQNLKVQITGQGISSRLIMLHASEPTQLVALPKEFWGGKPALEWMKEAGIVEDLQIIANMKGAYESTPEADIFHKRWYAELKERIIAQQDDPRKNPWVYDFWSRKQVHLNKLAMILAASKRNELIITLEDYLEAARRCDEVEEQIYRIFRNVNNGAQSHPAILFEIIEHLCLANKKIKKRDLYEYLLGEMGYMQLEAAYNYLVQGDFIKAVIEGNESWIELGGKAQAHLERKLSRNGLYSVPGGKL